MSHFSVLVFTKGCPSQEQLSDILMPWHEFECTGHDNQYVQDIDKTDEAREEYESRVPTKDHETFAEWAHGWYGSPIIKQGETVGEDCKYGYILTNGDGDVLKIIDRTNPNAKWDWWQIGGRYANKFSMKNPLDDPRNWETCTLCGGTGKRTDDIGNAQRMINPEYGCNGCEGTGKSEKWPSRWVTEGDQVRLVDLDYDGLKEKAVKQREDWVRDIIKKSECTREDVALACALDRKAHAEWLTLAEPKPRGPEYTKWLEAKGGDYPTLVNVKRRVWDLPTIAEGQTLDAWVKAAPPITAFAVVKDGKWYDRGDMGWWGCVSNEKDEHEWEREVAKLMSVYESDDWVTCVDCHI